MVFESYTELRFIYLSHITDESNILSCHHHFYRESARKDTSIESFKSGSEENKKQRSSALSYRLRIQPLKLFLLEFQVENGILLIAVVRVWVIYRLYQRLEPRNLHESRKTWSDGFPGTALPIAAEISYLAKKTTLNSPELKFLNVKP